MINKPRTIYTQYDEIEEFKEGMSTVASIVLTVLLMGSYFAGSNWGPRIYDMLLILFIGTLIARIGAVVKSEDLRLQIVAEKRKEDKDKKLQEEAKERRKTDAMTSLSPEEMEKKYGIRPKHTVKERQKESKKIIKFPKR